MPPGISPSPMAPAGRASVETDTRSAKPVETGYNSEQGVNTFLAPRTEFILRQSDGVVTGLFSKTPPSRPLRALRSIFPPLPLKTY